MEIDEDIIKSVLRKLNYELMFPSTDIIQKNLMNKADVIEPIKYKYKIINDPAEFEELLYITIEDSMARKYKYKLVENALEDLTTIGNKLEYTDEDGTMVRKQSIADFNVNLPAVVIRRETYIDISKIPELLGYIYQDMKYYGTEGLPVPNIEVDFYIPGPGLANGIVAMFNGTILDFSVDKITKQTFHSTNVGRDEAYIIGGNEVPGSTYVTVKYVNSKGEVLKENRVGNVFPNSSFMPDVIPVINDKEGKEWVFENDSFMPLTINENPDLNVVELKYIELYSRVTISCINREGNKICEDKQEIVQVGTNYDVESKNLYRDKNGDDWKLVFTRPTKLIVRQEEESNKIIFVYDIEKIDVTIKFVNTAGEEILERQVVQAPIEKLYKANVVKYVVGKDGLGWNYNETSTSTILVRSLEENIITLVYEEAKARVVTRLKNENNINITDEKIEFVQIGKKHSVTFEKEVVDFSLKEWKLHKTNNTEIVVDKNDSKNVIEAIYEPNLAKAIVKFVNMLDKPIKDSITEDAQIGGMYSPEGKIEIVDNFGKMWICKNKDEEIVISAKETENLVILKYEPLMSTVTIKYLDIEGNKLLEPKTENLQVGSAYKNTPIKKITDDSGRKWIIEDSKIPTITVSKHNEENILELYYGKEMAKATLSFYDAFNNVLRDSQVVESQIGAPLDDVHYVRITDIQGNKWMMESSEPKNLLVKDSNNEFKLIYGEVKAKVLVRHINVKSGKAFVDDTIDNIKLGGIYVPNIRTKIIDRNKWQWKYIGEENVSIVTKENEQENIIILNYEEDTSKIILKYRNKNEEKIREDAIKELQIGKEIRVEPILKFNDNNGLGWKYVSSDGDTKTVKNEDNIIINYYEPLLGEVISKFCNEDKQEIVESKVERIQVGKKYDAKIAEKISDSHGALWRYKSVSAEQMIVKEEQNDIYYLYEKLCADVTIYLKNMDEITIVDPIVQQVQVGTMFEPKIDQKFEDNEGKAWILDSVDLNKFKISEDVSRNIVNIKYKKELIEVQLCFYGDDMVTIRPHQIIREQIGSVFVANPDKIIIDNKMLGWSLKEDLIPHFKVKKNPGENIVNLTYEKYLVDTIVKFLGDRDEEIVKDLVLKCQVGTTFMAKIEDYILDEKGKEWVYAVKLDNKLFSTAQKLEPITISQVAEKNVIKIKYKPSMNKVMVKFVDSIGQEIRPMFETEAQVGSEYVPEILNKIVGIKNTKWVYNPNSKSTIKVDKDANKNIINLAYEAEKATVVYKYKNEYNEEIKQDKKELIQIGSIYYPKPENVIEGIDGRFWEYNAQNTKEFKVDDDEANNIIEVMYNPLNVDVVIRYINLKGKSILSDTKIKAQLGSTYKANPSKTLADEESRIYTFIRSEPESIKIKEIPMGAIGDVNVIELTYEAIYGEARIIFKDSNGNKLKDDEIKQMQVGEIFNPGRIQYITDRKGIQWEIINDKIDPIRIREDSKENQIVMTYEVAKAEVLIRYKDVDGNIIKEANIYHLDIGTEFVPEVQSEIIDKEQRKWIYVRTDPVKLTIGSINNIINIIYQEKKAFVTIKYNNTADKKLKDDLRVKVQIGSKYEAPVVNKIIYDENFIWRYAYNSPTEIVVSEISDENIIIQYYTDDTAATKKQVDDGKYHNVEAQKFVDEKLVEETERIEQEKRQREEEEAKKRAAEISSSIKIMLEGEHLQNLERIMELSNIQKDTINKLDGYNKKIINILRNSLDNAVGIIPEEVEKKFDEIFREEKKLAQEGLKEIIENDRTGNKLLKIFEAITAPEIDDINFGILQQKRSILMADYLTNRNVANIEQATYIIDVGKTQKGIECLQPKLEDSKTKVPELLRLKIILIYEKAMLDNYYRARSIIKDDYFEDETVRLKLSKDVVVLVANMIPNQAIKLFKKIGDMTLTQKNELDALMKLVNNQQNQTIEEELNNIKDGRIRKNAIKLFKEYTSMK